MPETFLGMPKITRRGFVKGSAAVAGTTAVASTFLFKTLDAVLKCHGLNRDLFKKSFE